jgi:hypothetical protein
MDPQALRQQPIPPASEPMQYRAIGLIYGKYQASAEQFTRGTLTTGDGIEIGAVLLGRVMSLVKKHLDLEQSHLWVVYPRTRDKTDELHMQVVGVWEPEKLAQGKLLSGDAAPAEIAPVNSTSETNSHLTQADEPQDGYFSIRGEVLYYSPDEERLIVKIQQSPRSGSDQVKAFKLNLQGLLESNKAVGYFWDLQVQRENNLLVVKTGSVVGLVPPKKRKDQSSQERRRTGAPRKGPRPSRMGDRPVSRSSSGAASGESRASAPRREPIAKPVKRPKNSSS